MIPYDRWRFIVLFYFLEFGSGQMASLILFVLMKLDFISQLSLNCTLPFAGLQHMQQCQKFKSLHFVASMLLSQINVTWKMVWTVMGLNSQPLSYESSAFTTRPWLLCSLFSIVQYLVGLRVNRNVKWNLLMLIIMM